MKIKKPHTLKQALANMKLENLSPSPEVSVLLQQALVDENIDTEDIISLLRAAHRTDEVR
ncbi:hypothetical protein [Thalassotalea piscium]|uniref:Uncharacterized protein n=1 Tax=Thalassotalea piscium TaxID=1230533 RepID=A0A7X0NE01_9GAMM|nr:hypothetical protein [Thalassotalea piscium]MBB6541704.1 hypothetical protein [Thalassotalea piscium]